MFVPVLPWWRNCDDSVFIMNIAIIDESEDEYQEPATEAGFHSISGDAVVKPRPLAPQFCVSGETMAQPVEPPGDLEILGFYMVKNLLFSNKQPLGVKRG